MTGLSTNKPTVNSYDEKTMKTNSLLFFILYFCSINLVHAQVTPPKPFGPVPNENQLQWQEMEYYAFIHLSVNTYTDQPWGFGDEDPEMFNPVDLDAMEWARIAKEAGMKGIILTAKHHSGFCLWPSEFTDYSIENSPYKNGTGDIVKEVSDAAKEYGLRFGVYLSPWDRNHPDYGKPEYITYFRNQLTELLTNSGEVFEIWFDGAHGGTGYYGGAYDTRNIDRSTYYDWGTTYKMVRELQPDIVIWNDGGKRADLRWVGTEAGYVGETNWSLLDSTGNVEWGMLHYGLEDGNSWVPGEVNTSIRPEWFYHPKEDDRVKTLPDLMDIYYQSIGRNATLLLNFPIMPNGKIHEKDEQAVLEFGEEVSKIFDVNLVEGTEASATNVRGNSSEYEANNVVDGNTDTYWATDDEVKTASLTVTFNEPTEFNRFMAQEYIALGQRVKSFTIEGFVDGEWKELSSGTTIGYKRILRFETVETTKLRLNILDSKSSPIISNIGAYKAPQILTAPKITRIKNGDVIITPADPESEVYYTLDGTPPSLNSIRYSDTLETSEGKVEIRTFAYDPETQKQSPLSEARFDISRDLWSILNIEDENVLNVLDGNEETNWHLQPTENKPTELAIDLGKTQNITGFRYLPDQNWWASGSYITQYQFYVSEDAYNWTLVDEGEFSNIVNNPFWQEKTFPPTDARYFKIRTLETSGEGGSSGFAELDIITN